MKAPCHCSSCMAERAQFKAYRAPLWVTLFAKDEASALDYLEELADSVERCGQLVRVCNPPELEELKELVHVGETRD